MLTLGSSYRDCSPETTLERARAVAERVGVTRVTDVTRLDRIGIPVWSGIRPTAAEGSLCVNAGKGIRSIDAQVGAYMESIEFALAEPGGSGVPVVTATPRDVLDGATRPAAVLDFCPIARRRIDPDSTLACVEADELIRSRRVLVPAELVLLPYVNVPGTGCFGSSSNGLASGNTLREATLHGLLEVIERDIRSFCAIRKDAQPVHPASLPVILMQQLERVANAGCFISVLHLPNEFGLPCFEALLRDPAASNSLVLASGYGCHLDPTIAAARAITEAVQSRLSWIHGARDDLALADAAVGDSVTAAAYRKVSEQFEAYARGPMMDFAATPSVEDVRDIDDAIARVAERLMRNGISAICRVAYTEPAAAVQVVRILVPRLEYLDRFSHRIGPRLHALLRSS